MSPSEKSRLCHVCKQGELIPTTRQRTFAPFGKQFVVDLLTSRCNACGAQSTNSQQHKENLSRLQARKEHYGHLLLGEEISRFRRRYGLTQRAAARIFGKGLVSFSRYENETSYPDATTTKLLKQAMARPDVLKSLADEEGVQIPLWQARLEDARREKVARLMTQHDVPEFSHVWQRAVQKARSNADCVVRREGAFEVTFTSREVVMSAQNEIFSSEALAA